MTEYQRHRLRQKSGSRWSVYVLPVVLVVVALVVIANMQARHERQVERLIESNRRIEARLTR